MRLEEEKVSFIKKKYGAGFSGIVFRFEIGKFNELSFRFDSKEEPDSSSLGYDYSFDSMATRFQASSPVLMDRANFGEYYGGVLGYYWYRNVTFQLISQGL